VHSRCCSLSVGVALNVRFTTNGLSVTNNTHIYVARTSTNRVIMACDLYCCLLPVRIFAHLALSDRNTDIGQNDFTYVMSTETQSNNVWFGLNGCTCNSLGSSIAVWGVPNTIPTTKSLHFQVKQFLIFHQLIHLVHST